MNETKKRKDWIKNFAIIFLAVLLVLTFCSNTIMNYSLPEVAAQYCYSGEITNKIRGSGYVEAEDPYKVIFKQSRKVDSVAVRVGDEVQKGDVLFELEDGDSEELKNYKAQLEDYLIKNEVSDSYSGVVKEGEAPDFEANLAKVKEARKKVENLTKAVANTEASLEKFRNGTADEYAEYKALKDAQDAKTAWDTQHGINEANLAAAKTRFNYDSLEDDYQVALNDYNMAKADYDAKVADYNTKLAAYNTALAAYNTANSEYTAAAAAVPANTDPNYAAMVAIRDEKEAIKNTAEAAKDAAETAKDNAETAKNTAQSTLNTKQGDLNTADAAFKVAKNGIAAYLPYVNTSTVQKAEAEKAVANAQKAIDNKTAALEKTVANNKTALEKANSELTRLLSDVEVLAPILEKIKELENESKDLTITAPVSGTIVSVNYAAGQTIETGSEVATIQVAGKGYTMSLSIPAEKVSLVKIGDEAEVTNSWWYVNVHARIKSIKNDPQNPGKQKILVFELEGDVSNGQSLSVTVGQRTASYDTIVPSSAIRTDDQGKFVLRINTKSTPLGNRYIAERVDVTVLAEDETRTAVSGEFTGWDYIITNATKPIEDGQQVRLKD